MNSLLSLLFLIIDIFIYNLTPYHTYLFLVSLTLYRKKDYFPILVLGLLIDLVIAHTYVLNALILLFLFYLSKKVFKIRNKKIMPFIGLNSFYCFFYCTIIYI